MSFKSGGGGGGARDPTMRPPSLSSSVSVRPRGGGGGGNTNPPSRHLWVGNVSNRPGMESLLSEHFVRFGPLESISFLPGRSYGFVNFEREEDAVEAKEKLQGFVVADLPLKIEFSKSDKSAAASRDKSFVRRDEQHAINRGSPFTQMDSRPRHGSPDAFLPENSRADDHTEEIPSEVLWIGFPAALKVDETILRKAFSPFGEIERISAYPGRTYAFVRFRNLLSSCRAKETLQGKLFGNPRVHIRFARSEPGMSGSVRRGSGLDAPPPHYENGHSESFDNYRPERNFGDFVDDPNIRQPPPYAPKMDYRDSDMVGFGMNEPSWKGGNIGYEQQRFNELAPKQGYPGDAHFPEFSPPRFPRKHPFPDDPWESPESESVYDGGKRMKMGPGAFPPPERELPEYPFSGSEQGKHGFPRMFPEFPLPDEPGHMRFTQMPDLPSNTVQPFGDRTESWKRPAPDMLQPPSHESFHPAPNPADWKRPTDFHQPPVTQEWKWEGTIAKGGTPVCRARCFPVGRVLDILLPEFLDCTARTGLEMLAKHYYQAADTWVVFFVPQSDADITYYNEFMNYLGEKQRAAVAKIDERNTLFLVPPSEFSEKVLKVPGRLSMSGVVLRLEPPSPNPAPVPPLPERRPSQYMPPQSTNPYQRSDSPSGPFPPGMSYQNMEKQGFGGPAPLMNTSTLTGSSSFSGYDSALPDAVDRRQELPSNHQLHGLIPDGRSTSSHGPHGTVGHVQEPNMPNYASGYPAAVSGVGSNSLSIRESKPSASLPTPLNSLQPEQLALLASSLLGQQKQQPGSSCAASISEDYRSSTMNQPGNPPVSQRHVYQVSSESPATQYSQLQQSSNVQAINAPALAQGQVNQQLLSNANNQEEGEADPQRRLQATLQLAAALLQQIQQGKGP